MGSNSEIIIGVIGTVIALMMYRLSRAEKRPMLTMEPAISPTTKSYFVFTEEHGNPTLVVQCLIKNVGSLIANNITIKSAFVSVTSKDEYRDTDTAQTPEDIFLNPGEERVICIKYKTGQETAILTPPEYVNLDLHLTYTSESNARYSNLYKYKIFSDNAELLNSKI